MKGNHYKATIIIVVVSLGFLLSYPFQHTFMGGLLTSGFRAAMIGGLADWFAVSALFRRPLGIPFRTAIIPRNRDKIFSALVYMVEHEILMKDNIKKRLDEYDLSVILLYLLNTRRSKQDVRKMIYRFLQDFFLQVKTEELETMIEKFVENKVEKIKLVPYIIYTFQWFIKHGYYDQILDLLLKQCILAAQHDKLSLLLSDVFSTVQEKYERGMNRRKLFNRLMDLSPKQLAQAAQHGLGTILEGMKSSDHPTRLRVQEKIEEFIGKLERDSDFQEEIELWLQKYVIHKFRLGELLTQTIMKTYTKLTTDERVLAKGIESLMAQIEILITNFEEDAEDRRKLDSYLKRMISDWIDLHHDQIGRMVKESLNDFTNEKLVSFIENKLGDDLQIIRINGSIVGGLVGMMIYLFTFWL